MCRAGQKKATGVPDGVRTVAAGLSQHLAMGKAAPQTGVWSPVISLVSQKVSQKKVLEENLNLLAFLAG